MQEKKLFIHGDIDRGGLGNGEWDKKIIQLKWQAELLEKVCLKAKRHLFRCRF